MDKLRLKINLQLFASDDKTEEPTSKRKEDARKKGQVVQSREINGALTLLVAFLALKFFSKYLYVNLNEFIIKVFKHYTIQKDILDGNNLWILVSEIFILTLKIISPILGAILIIGLICSYAQVGILFTTEPLKPNFKKFNPVEGFKRLFSAHAIMELIKAIVKIIVLGYTAYSYLEEEMNNFIYLIDMELMTSVSYVGTVVVNVAIRIAMALIILAIIDYVFQWKQHNKSLKMTKQEVKEEYKQAEGDPKVKGKIKEKQRQISLRRMMTDIPKADVVITNPTHFAVAIRYDAKVADAPVVLAKGQDYIALRIKEIAKNNKVEIVENKPLARALYATSEIGERIPPDLFQAVAEVLAFVYSLKK